MQGVLAERPVNQPAPQDPTPSSTQFRLPAQSIGDAVFKTPKAKPPKMRNDQSLLPVTPTSDAQSSPPDPLLQQFLFKVPRTPHMESISTPSRKHERLSSSHDTGGQRDSTFLTPRDSFRTPQNHTRTLQDQFRTPHAQTPGASTTIRKQGQNSTPTTARKEKLAFPDTPSPCQGHVALPSPSTTTNGVSQRVLPSVGLRLEEAGAGEEEAAECCICHDKEGENLIVFCDGCDLAVHPSCYGYPLSREVPEGTWLCERCEHPSPSAPRCSLCPSAGGAMKRTTDWQWAHLSCGFFIPEVFFLGPNGNDYVHTLHVPRVRFRMLCHVCEEWHGACVHCTETGCDRWFHVTCGQARGFAIEYRRNKHGRDIVLAFCEAHTTKWEKDKREKKRFKISSKLSVKKR